MPSGIPAAVPCCFPFFDINRTLMIGKSLQAALRWLYLKDILLFFPVSVAEKMVQDLAVIECQGPGKGSSGEYATISGII